MSTVQSAVKCKQCGFPEAWEVFDCRSNEWSVDRFRCGYRASWRHESYFSNGHLERGVHTVHYSAGAYCVKKTDNGIEEHGSLSEADVEEIAVKMRDDIAAGRLSEKSYVTKFNFETGEVTPLVGHVPTCNETQAEEECNPRDPLRGPVQESVVVCLPGESPH